MQIKGSRGSVRTLERVPIADDRIELLGKRLEALSIRDLSGGPRLLHALATDHEFARFGGPVLRVDHAGRRGTRRRRRHGRVEGERGDRHAEHIDCGLNKGRDRSSGLPFWCHAIQPIIIHYQDQNCV